MAEQATQTINRAVRTERRETRVDGIWRGIDYLVRGRFTEAQESLTKKGHDASPARSLELALAMQNEDLDEVDFNDWKIDQLATNLAVLTILEMPQTAAANDRLREGNFASNRERNATKATISRFNQDLAETLAFAPDDMLPEFSTQLRVHSNDLLRDQWHLATLSNEDYNSAVAGISREVALWRALMDEMPEGWETRGATVEEDLVGIDLKIYDPDGNELLMDSKTAGSFLGTLKKRYEGGYMDLHEVEEARERGYFYKSGHNPEGEEVSVCVMDADRLGKIENFKYKDTEPVFTFVEKQIAEQQGKRLRKVGKSAINN